jgi:GDP-L-fucose synthase
MLGRSIVESWRRQRPDDELYPLSRREVDLRDRSSVRAVIEEIRPDSILHAAAKVGGIGAKLAEPTPFLLDNLLLDTSVLSAAIELEVPELLYVGSAVVYPQEYLKPFVEDDIMTGVLEPANEGYGLAKISAVKVCEYASKQFGLAYRAALPSNLYGPYDHFDLANAHLIAATLAKVDQAARAGERVVNVWGDGSARREFTFSEDLADWLVQQVGSLAEWPPTLNLGYGTDYSVREFYEFAQEIVGYDGRLEYDTSKPAGTPQRLIDSSAARALGWAPSTSIREGMLATYQQYLRSL